MSIALLDVATIFAIYSIAIKSILFSALYTLFVFVAFGLIIYTFCRKCKTRNDCSHVFFGPITRLMPESRSKVYSKSDYYITGLLVFLVVILPQYWLWQLTVLPYLYLGLLAVIGLQINKYVCAKCNNTACAMCKKKLIVTS